MEQYPDTIVVTVTAPSSESGGIYTAGTATSYTLKCRAEANGSGRQIAGADGSVKDFAFICYLPVMSTVIPDASDYVLTSAFNGTIRGKIKRAVNGQLNSRLWL